MNTKPILIPPGGGAGAVATALGEPSITKRGEVMAWAPTS
jgi:hypothetical protein